MSLSKKLRDIREQKGYTISYVSRRTGISEYFLNRMENSRFFPPQDEFLKLEKLYNAGASYYIYDNEKANDNDKRIPTELRLRVLDILLSVLLLMVVCGIIYSIIYISSY